MDKQIIISISREYGSGGHEIAERIAKQFGLTLYDRSMLDEIAEAKNIQIEYLEKYDEKPRKLFGSRRVGAYTNSMEEIIAEMQFEYLKEKADTGESFFILGDEQVKLERIMKKYNLDEQEAAAKIKRHDKNRRQYHNRHSTSKWGDSRAYDMCINDSKLGIEKTTETLAYFIEESISGALV